MPEKHSDEEGIFCQCDGSRQPKCHSEVTEIEMTGRKETFLFSLGAINHLIKYLNIFNSFLLNLLLQALLK